MSEQAETQEVDILNMSDEEIMNFDPSTLNAPVEEQGNEEGEEASEDQEAEGYSEESNDDDSSEESSESEEANEGEGKSTEEVDESKSEKQEQSQEETSEVDYKSAYEKLTAPFKANGRDIQVKSVDDAITLMQMGANYNKKMAALKPSLRLMKMLESNGLLSEEKLSYLIDLEKKNPDAISKLVKDSGVDPLEIDTDKASDYKPSTYKVDEREIELDQVLDSIQETPSYSKTLDIVSNKWDASSKQVIANTPQLLTVINQHVQAGIYDLISKEIESERMFGRLDGLSDIEAYRQVGDAIQARGGFNHLVPNQGQQTQQPQRVVQPKPKQADEDKRREKKRAASSTKASAPSKTVQDFDPLAMSDEEFSKLANQRFY
jgi:hypothetical protein